MLVINVNCLMLLNQNILMVDKIYSLKGYKMPKVMMSKLDRIMNKLDHRNCDGLIHIASILSSDQYMLNLYPEEKVALLNILHNIEKHNQMLPRETREKFYKQMSRMFRTVKTK